jgi:5-oxopent-3-ene-1,2,5-tricarboxylate decarboxylase/2-hydroxyhepta-2,4-diene-1,7-dioate isomerase
VRVARIEHDGNAAWCAVEDGVAHLLDGDIFASPEVGTTVGPVSEVKLLRPVESHNKVVCLLSNWRSKDDRDGPGFFIKPPTTLIDPGEPIVYPDLGIRVVYEAEMAIVVGQPCRSVTVEQARARVFGYTCFNDVTAFEMSEATNFSFLAGKSFDTFGAMGPWIDTDIDPDNASLRASVSGRLITDTNTSRMVWSTDEIVSWISRFMTLFPGDVISCGTPPEYDAIKPGDEVEITIEGIGTLANPVVA